MKVSFTPAINNNNLYKKTMSSPITFRGENSDVSDIFESSYTEKKGLFRKIEKKSFYNKRTGGMTQLTIEGEDNVTERKEFFPNKGLEVTTTIDKNGIATIREQNEYGETIQKLDTENRRIYYESNNNNGLHIVEVTDYERGRTVIRTTENGSELPVVVIDLDTGSSVTSGPLVIDTRYDEQSGTHITENIVTKAKHREVKKDEKGKVVWEREFNPQTGQMKVERLFDTPDAGLLEDTYTGEQNNKLVKTLCVSIDGSQKDVILFKEDGETILSHTQYTYKRNGQLESESKFNSDEILTERIEYKRNGSKTVDTYDPETRKRTRRKTYNSNNGLIEETIYAQDGKTKELERRISKGGGYSVSKYNEDGIEAKRIHFGEDKKVELIEIFNTTLNQVKMTIEYNKTTGERKIVEYDEEYESPLNETLQDKDGNTLVKTIFHPDGETPLYERSYNPDGSYTDTAFDIYGDPIEIMRYTKDGQKK